MKDSLAQRPPVPAQRSLLAVAGAGPAQEVLVTPARLRALLEATRAISGDLALPVLLSRVVEKACELVGAQCGVLELSGEDGDLAELLPVDVPTDLWQQIVQLPEGSPVREALTPRVFVEAPLQVRDTLAGHLYVVAPHGGRFTAEDEVLLDALAGAAASAIHTARLALTAQRRQRWMDASTAITAQLVAGDSDPLPLIAHLARKVAGADLSTIVLPAPDEPETLVVAAASGTGAERCAGMPFPRGSSLTGSALDKDEDLVVNDVGQDQAYLKEGVPLGPALIVRLRTPDGSLGALTLTRESAGRGFTGQELAMAAGFAAQASVALKLREAQRAARLLDLLNERERIAEVLHDGAVKELFATALALQSLAAKIDDPTAKVLLSEHVDRVESSIRSIRRSVFNAQERHESDWRRHVFDVASRFGAMLGGEPQVILTGASADVPAPVAEAAVTGMREVLAALTHLQDVAVTAIAVDRTEVAVEVSVTAQIPDGTDIGDLVAVSRRLVGGRVQPTGTSVTVQWAVPLGS